MPEKHLEESGKDALNSTDPKSTKGKVRSSRKRGRPRKEAEKPENFLRAGIVMSIYDEARQDGQKHSAAVRQAVEFTKQRHPEMSISETEVRRTLARFRPRTSETIPLFERLPVTEGEVETLRRMMEQVPAAQQRPGSNAPLVLDISSFQPRTKYVIRFGERPSYPRHNRKIFKD